MNIRITWILVAVLCASLAVMLFPAQQQRRSNPGVALLPQGEVPRLTITDAQVQSFDQDGNPSWTMQSPRIAYFQNGRLVFASPRMLLQSESGSRLEARSGEGALMPGPLQDRLELTSRVDAKVFGEHSELDFTTENLQISRNGKLVTAPSPILLSSSEGETTAARLDLDLQDDLLLLGSTPENRVVTRLQPSNTLQ